MKKTCTKCRLTLPASAEYFSPQKRGLFGLTATCKSCRAQRTNEYHAVNPLPRIASGLKRKFGITLEQYDAMLLSQGGVCAICKEPPSKKRLSVDHCHATEKIRGLLCHNCNVSIGLMKENPARLYRAIEYLNANTAR